MADEQVIVDIKVDDKEVLHAEKSIDNLTDSIQKLADKIKAARDRNKEFTANQNKLNDSFRDGLIDEKTYKAGLEKLTKQRRIDNKLIAESTITMAKQKNERKANIRLISNESNRYDKLSAKLIINRKKAKELGLQYGLNSAQFKKAARGVQQLDAHLKKLDDKLGQNQRSVGKYTDAFKNLGSQLLGAFGITFGIQTLISAGEKFYEQSKKLIEITQKVTTNFGLTGKAAKSLASDILAISDTFEVDYNQTLIAANTVSKELGISVTDSMKFIEEGFLKGSNNSGEFLEILREYPAQFKAAGIDAGTMFSIINRQVTEGIYSDKGVDAIKEGGLRLRENTKAVQDALRPLDESIKKQIQQEVAAGRSFEAIKLVSEALNDTSLTAEQVQAIIADVFGGAGEDAGLRYLQTLKDVESTLSDVSIQATDSEVASLNLSKTWNRFVSSVSDSDGIFSKLWTTFKTVLANSLRILSDMVNLVSGGDKAIDKVSAAIERLKNKQVEQTVATEDEKKKQQELAKERDKSSKVSEAATKRRLADLEKAQKREADAAEKLLEINQKRKLALIKDDEELRAALIEIEAASIAKSLQNTEAGEVERQLMIEVSTDRIAAINERFDKKEEERQKKILDRKKAANDKIKEINDDFALSQIQDRDELEEALIKLEEERLAILLEDEKLLAEERIALITETEERIREIKEGFKEEAEEKDVEARERAQELIEDSLSEIAKITAKFAGEEIAIFSSIAAGIAKAFEDGKLSASSALKGIQSVANGVFDAIGDRRQQDLDAVEASRQKELELAGDNQAAINEINITYDKKAADLKRKQFNADKTKALIDIAIQASVAAVKTAAQLGFPAAIPFVAAVAALGVAQGAIVAKQKPPRFAEGVNDIVSIGDSHASGRDVDVWGYSGNQKQYFGKVEKGEAMPVIRKSAVNDYLISKLNGKFSGNNGYYQEGTPDITSQNQVNAQISTESLIEAFSNVQIVAKIEDITKEARKKIQIVDNSKV